MIFNNLDQHFKVLENNINTWFCKIKSEKHPILIIFTSGNLIFLMFLFSICSIYIMSSSDNNNEINKENVEKIVVVEQKTLKLDKIKQIEEKLIELDKNQKEIMKLIKEIKE